jgi:hypothetical protein
MRLLKTGEKATLTDIGNIVQKSELLPMLRELGAVDEFRLYKESSQSWIQTHDDLVVRHQLYLENIARAAQTDDSSNVDEEEHGLGDLEMDSMEFEAPESDVGHQVRGSSKRKRKKSRTFAPRKTNMPSKKNSPPPSDPPPVSDSPPAMTQADLASGMSSLRQLLESHGKKPAPKPAPHAAPEQATEPARLLQLTNEKLAKDLEAQMLETKRLQQAQRDLEGRMHRLAEKNREEREARAEKNREERDARMDALAATLEAERVATIRSSRADLSSLK